MGNTLTFTKEAEFEKALIDELLRHDWGEVLEFKDENELIENWKKIIFENNCSIDRLDKYPLTDTEMGQILEEIDKIKTPCKLNGFINGKTISIKRDNPDDIAHFGKEISLKIFDRNEISGKSRYQIVRQPRFYRNKQIQRDRRGDLLLLINGMPVIHIELKASGINVGEAIEQINKYSQEGIFKGIFSLIQVFVAMTPEETVYFANNPNSEGRFNDKFYFHWGEVNNEPVNDWKKICSQFLSIPMAHNLIGSYTVADGGDNNLKVLRSYQYYAVYGIFNKVSENKWFNKDQRGGYIWHTTGSGKTMTSFKAAQLIADYKKADKVVFLMDRIELGNQSLLEYRGFAGECIEIQATENTNILKSKLKSNDNSDTLIVTSIQKMSKIKLEEGINEKDIAAINSKRIVFIIDECHRSTFGEMIYSIKNTFTNALFFGFSGTPIQDENKKDDSTTSDVFGNEIHRYSISDGIRDRNVLGFDIKYTNLMDIEKFRKQFALEKAHVKTEEEAMEDPLKKRIYLDYMLQSTNLDVENRIPNVDFELIKENIVEDIFKSWVLLSSNYKFHAILATSSIKEACEYYDLFKKFDEDGYDIKLKVTCVFDDCDTGADGFAKETKMIEILEDYNNNFNFNYTLSDWGKFKKDVALRLAHKKQYENLKDDKKLNIVIVVDQMLTGYDSKWVNTLYLDKELKNEGLVQAFSRTNRLCDSDKPFGNIVCYRRCFRMEENVNEAFRIYSGNKTGGIFVNKLKDNLTKMNLKFDEIKLIYENNKIYDFSKNPDSEEDRQKIANLINELADLMISSKIQGYNDGKNNIEQHISKDEIFIMHFSYDIYLRLLQRYRELFNRSVDGKQIEKVPYGFNPIIAQSNKARVDYNFFNSKFKKWYKIYQQYKDVDGHKEEIEEALNEFNGSYLSLSPEDQEIVKNIIFEVRTGELFLKENETLIDCINAKKAEKENDSIKRFCEIFGYDEKLVREILKQEVTEANINEYGRRDKISNTLDIEKAEKYFIEKFGHKISRGKIVQKSEAKLNEFILGTDRNY